MAKCQWVKKESSKYISFNRASDFSNEKDIWQDFEYMITIPADFDLDGENRLSLYGQYGDTEGTVLVSDVKVEYLFTDSEIITPVYADFVSGIEECCSYLTFHFFSLERKDSSTNPFSPFINSYF